MIKHSKVLQHMQTQYLHANEMNVSAVSLRVRLDHFKNKNYPTKFYLQTRLEHNRMKTNVNF